MRTAFTHFAWGLATVAIAVAVPVRAAAFERPGSPSRLTSSSVSTATVSAGTLTPTTATLNTTEVAANIAHADAAQTVPIDGPRSETGGGWTELFCLGCVAAGAYALYTGGIAMLPTILANPEAIGALTGACLTACRSVIESLM